MAPSKKNKNAAMTPFEIVPTVRAPDYINITEQQRTFAQGEIEKRERLREFKKQTMRNLREKHGSNWTRPTLEKKQADSVRRHEAAQRLEGRHAGVAGACDIRNLDEVLPHGQGYMMNNMPFDCMRSLMLNFNDPVFKAYFECNGVPITLTHEEAMNRRPPKQNDPKKGKYLLFYWHQYDEQLDQQVKLSSLRENKMKNPGRSFGNAYIVDEYLRTTLETVRGILTHALHEKIQWPTNNKTQPEFGVVGSGSTPVHQDIHCDNRPSYKLALATSLAIFRPLIDSGGQSQAEEFHRKTEKQYGWILHMPTTLEGMALRVAVYTDLTFKHVEIRTIFIPFGSALLLRADVFHSGHYGSAHNIRLHGVLPPDNLDWEDAGLLFLENNGWFDMPEIARWIDRTSPKNMLNPKFNPTLSGCTVSPTGTIIGPRANDATTYLHSFQRTLHDPKINSIYHDQYQLLEPLRLKMNPAPAKTVAKNNNRKKEANLLKMATVRKRIKSKNKIMVRQAKNVQLEAQKLFKNTTKKGMPSPTQTMSVPVLRPTCTDIAPTFNVEAFINTLDCIYTEKMSFEEKLHYFRYEVAIQEIYYYLECESPPTYNYQINWTIDDMSQPSGIFDS